MATEPESIVARRIEEIRKSRRLSRQQLADKLGITYLQVYRIEKGIVKVTADFAVSIADALRTPVTSLYREAKA